MDILVDASAILAVLLNEPERDRIIKATKDASLLAPGSLPFEIGNAISALFRRKDLTLVDGLAVYHAFLAIPIRLAPVDIPKAISRAFETGLYAYDAYFIAAAEAWQVPLLTLDRRLAAAAKDRGVMLMEV
ncbi:MAG: type II toxin-antitoxin system VapC family toxin [Spirochaetota bacterium]